MFGALYVEIDMPERRMEDTVIKIDCRTGGLESHVSQPPLEGELLGCETVFSSTFPPSQENVVMQPGPPQSDMKLLARPIVCQALYLGLFPTSPSQVWMPSPPWYSR